MACPACNGAFKKHKLDELLMGESCIECKGVRFTLSDYLHYLSRTSAVNDTIDQPADFELDNESKKALACSCGQIMSKYKIIHNSDRRVDSCNACQSIWLDNGEWEFLKSHNLHRVVNKIFTQAYQRNIRLQVTRDVLQNNYEQLLGADDYQRIQEVRSWIEENKNKAVLKAYINANDPYSAEK